MFLKNSIWATRWNLILRIFRSSEFFFSGNKLPTLTGRDLVGKSLIKSCFIPLWKELYQTNIEIFHTDFYLKSPFFLEWYRKIVWQFHSIHPGLTVQWRGRCLVTVIHLLGRASNIGKIGFYWFTPNFSFPLSSLFCYPYLPPQSWWGTHLCMSHFPPNFSNLNFPTKIFHLNFPVRNFPSN